MRRFQLVRHSDPSGVSGTGVVADGVEFNDGTVALRWTCARPATSVWNCIDDLISVHGHNGRTVVHWLDSFDRNVQYADADPPPDQRVPRNSRRSACG